MFALLAAALASPPLPSGIYAPPCMRTVIGTGRCEQLELMVRGEDSWVYEITRDRQRERVVDGRHVFRESTVRLGPFPAELTATTLSWVGTEPRSLSITTTEEGPRLVDGDRTWHPAPSAD